MRKVLFGLLFSFFVLFFASSSFAQTEFENLAPVKEEFFKATVVEIIEQTDREIAGKIYPLQKVKLKIAQGQEKDKQIIIDHGLQFALTEVQKVKVGQKVVLIKNSQADNIYQYQIVDKYRIDNIFKIAIFFFLTVLILARLKGLGSILGMFISLGTIVLFIVPQILAGRDPLIISIIGSIFILIVTIYMAHGFSKKTTIAVVSTFITLVFSGLISLALVNFSKLTGGGSDDAYSLRFGQAGSINLKGLLLGGIIIGALGVLDDITTSLSATISELAKNNPALKFQQLVKSGFNVGIEHISSLVNTLVLAYAGASLPIFIFIVLNPTNQPLWFILNSEFMAEEIIRTLAGSFGLVLAVPITTVLAAGAFAKKRPK